METIKLLIGTSRGAELAPLVRVPTLASTHPEELAAGPDRGCKMLV